MVLTNPACIFLLCKIHFKRKKSTADSAILLNIVMLFFLYGMLPQVGRFSFDRKMLRNHEYVMIYITKKDKTKEQIHQPKVSI